MKLKYTLLILLQVIILVSMIGYRQYWVSANQHILLDSLPVDPRDMFRGDYVTLRYELSDIDLDKFNIKEAFRRNNDIYAVLRKADSGVYKLDTVSKTMPSQGTFIKGRVTYANDRAGRKMITLRESTGHIRTFEQPWFFHKTGDRILLCLNADGGVVSFHTALQKKQCREGETGLTGIVETIRDVHFRQVTAEYGIENYFVAEGKGHDIEKIRDAGILRAEVALRKNGKGLITALHMNGKRIP